MIDTLSPFTRRLVALALLFVAIVSGLNLVAFPAWALFRASLGRLGDARFERVQVEAVAARPPPTGGPLVRPSYFLAAPTRDAAIGQLTDTTRAAASALGLSGITITPEPMLPGQANRAAITVAVDGKEVAIERFIAGIEQDVPLKRVIGWRLSLVTAAITPPSVAASAAAPLRLEATIAAAWGARP